MTTLDRQLYHHAGTLAWRAMGRDGVGEAARDRALEDPLRWWQLTCAIVRLAEQHARDSARNERADQARAASPSVPLPITK